MKLSTRIRNTRLRAGLSQAELAERLGVSRTAVCNWESSKGRTQPSGERLAQIATLAGVSWDWLATGRGHATLSPENVPTAYAEFVEDPDERRLLEGFRASHEKVRMAMLAIADIQLPAHSAKR